MLDFIFDYERSGAVGEKAFCRTRCRYISFGKWANLSGRYACGRNGEYVDYAELRCAIVPMGMQTMRQNIGKS